MRPKRMMPTKPRSAATGLIAAAAFAAFAPAAAVTATPTAAPLPDDIARHFVIPHERIDIGGRTLNLHCMGSGERTVLLEAGGSDWSVTWALVQPLVAKKLRACAYDRAGLGYSDPAMLPRTPGAIVEDLRALIVAAKLPTPLILVGHSLGGFDVKLYAALYPDDVAGLVLVDPAEERQAERSRPFLRTKYDPLTLARGELLDMAWLGWLLDRYRECARLAGDTPMDPASIAYRRCSDPVRAPLGPLIGTERQRIQVTPAYQRAQASEILYSIYGNGQGDAVFARLFKPGIFGRKPLIVLTHGDYDRGDALAEMDQAAGVYLHRLTARLSHIGVQRTIDGTSHNMQIDKPMAIVAAIMDVEAKLAAPRPR